MKNKKLQKNIFDTSRLLSNFDLKKLNSAQTANIAFDIIAGAFAISCLMFDYDPVWAKSLLPIIVLGLMGWCMKTNIIK